jgi:hypothetical protein
MEINKEMIMENINNPNILEDLYQSNKKTFSELIKTIHNENPDIDIIIKYWYTRFFFKTPNKKGNLKKYIFTAFLIILTWIPIRLIFTILFEDNIYLVKAVPMIFSVTLSLFFLFELIKIKNIILSVIPNIILYIYLFILPNETNSQSINNAFYFMFVLLWFFILIAQSNFNLKKLGYNIFLEKCGELIVWSTIFIIGGSVIVGLSILLFNAIGIKSERFYEENIVTLGLVASPFISLLVIDNNNRIKLSVIIANIFLPVILISLAAFGIISIFTETKPYESRDIFIIYNIMTVIVICVLVFTGINGIDNKIINICSYILPMVTIILNIITLSAVVYRLTEYGISANKITLLGTNIVMLGHLIFIVYLKFKSKIERNILYLPVYFIWSCFVVFIFPIIFKFQ